MTGDNESIDDSMLHCDSDQTLLNLEFTMVCWYYLNLLQICGICVKLEES